MANKRTATSISGKREDIFLAGVEYLAKKYQIDDYAIITKNSYKISAETEAELDMKRELTKIFSK